MKQMLEDSKNILDNAIAYIKFLEDENEQLYALLEKIREQIQKNIE